MNRKQFVKALGGMVATAGVAFWNYKGEEIASTEEKLKLALPNEKSNADHMMVFQTNGIEKLRITSSGNVGLGILSPNSKLKIS